ncbi:MAG: hypothetical protein HY587_04035 [Candidatus Omnitrophica bacterium]|nr:hypothetical protein [Candidatus Omnitrophota bacterium]
MARSTALDHYPNGIEDRCHFTVSESKQWAELLEDLSRREKRAPEEILRDVKFSAVLHDVGLSRKERGARLLLILKEACLPNLSRLEEIWKAGLERLGRPQDVWIPLPRALESVEIENALECSPGRKKAGLAWIAENKSALSALCRQISEQVCFNNGPKHVT